MRDESRHASESPEKIYRLMVNNADSAGAIEKVVNAARRELRVFDATARTLRDRGFGSPSRIELIRALLAANRGHRLRIVLLDVKAIEVELPRLLYLLRPFSGQIEVHRTVDQATEARDPMIIADDSHYWRKPHVDQPRSVITMHDAVGTRPFLERFEEIWEKSESAASGTTLGL